MTDNELIAEFIGWTKDSNGFWIGCPNGTHYKLTFDSSWNELMPVVEKIRKLRDENLGEHDNGLAYSTITVYFTADGHRMDKDFFRASLLGTLVYKRMINSYQHTYDKVEVPHITKYGDQSIKVMYECITSFIKWYNSQKEQ